MKLARFVPHLGREISGTTIVDPLLVLHLLRDGSSSSTIFHGKPGSPSRQVMKVITRGPLLEVNYRLPKRSVTILVSMGSNYGIVFPIKH